MSDIVSLDEVEQLQQEIEAAVREPDPVLANLLITRCHYLLSQALQRALGAGAGANFHSWAVWGSRKAGVTIRQEDLDDARRDGTIVGGIVGALVGVGCGWLLQFPLWLEPGAAVLGAACGIAAGRLIINRSRRRSAGLVLAGNRTVLEDIGLQTVRFLRWLVQAAPAQPADAAAFLAPLQPGAVGQQNQELLRQAFTQYYRARMASSAAEKEQATYFGNCFAVWHEHVRLEPYIQGAMPLIIRRCVTQRLLQFDIGAVRLAVAQDVPANEAAAALALPQSAQSEQALALLRQGSGNVQSGTPFRGTAAGDWTRIKERMRYVFALFQAFHAEPQVFSSPYDAAQLAALAAGQRPAGTW
ncbi:hypothetical protein ACFST9_22365 [Hymenobacter monticola]|uniref:DUF3754 domain-containing protein n=1 Tax=Hymenobacter monticola TaxID=1705399 RepID=A0ABY4B5U1_9BACT|nr:hypothetical protein [Hymenobacter monticola]UOE34154.1 hypothetical protein MTP16_00540 [Hymenobacter monticola]